MNHAKEDDRVWGRGFETNLEGNRMVGREKEDRGLIIGAAIARRRLSIIYRNRSAERPLGWAQFFPCAKNSPYQPAGFWIGARQLLCDALRSKVYASLYLIVCAGQARNESSQCCCRAPACPFLTSRAFRSLPRVCSSHQPATLIFRDSAAGLRLGWVRQEKQGCGVSGCLQSVS